MKACVVGVGAVGGQIALALTRGGATTCAIARGQTLDGIRRDGLRVTFPEHEDRCELAASEDPAIFGVQDVVILAVKAPVLDTVADQIRPLLGPDTDVVAVMNGIPWWLADDPAGTSPAGLATLAGKHEHGRLLAGVVYTAAHITRPGHIALTTSRRRLILGETMAATAKWKTDLAATLERGGFSVRASVDIRVDIWNKLVANLGGNLVATVTGASFSDTFATKENREAAGRIIQEANAIAAATGISVDVDPDQIIGGVAKLPHRPSTLQDLDAGRPIELDTMFGAPLRIAKRHRVAIPTLLEWVDKLEDRVRGRSSFPTGTG
jgi:2-dehydropantoate 2-reductase